MALIQIYHTTRTYFTTSANRTPDDAHVRFTRRCTKQCAICSGYKFSDFHGGYLLGSYIVQVNKFVLAFRRNVMPPNITLKGVKTWRIKISIYTCQQAFLRSAGGRRPAFARQCLQMPVSSCGIGLCQLVCLLQTSVTARSASSLCRWRQDYSYRVQTHLH